MLSISPIANSASGASSYYLNEEKGLNVSDVALEKQENDGSYYLNEQSGVQSSQWFGRLAKEAGLLGQGVEQDKLEHVLSGDLNKESILYKKENHRAGYDLTFSAPKSVSLLALVGRDKRLLKAHDQAVKFVLSELEKDTAQAKHTNIEGSNLKYENTKNLLFAMVRHKTSREDDPQLHTHTLMANMTRDKNGKLRTLASSTKQSNGEINGTMERVYHHQKYYTSLYQSQLSRITQVLGYETQAQGNNLFEIKGIPQEVLDKFSTRSQQIKEQVETFGMDSQAAKEVAAKDTRKGKVHTADSDLNKQWQDKAATVFDFKGFVANAMEKEPKPMEQPVLNQRATAAIERALAHMSNQQSSFAYEKVIESALKDLTKGASLDAIDLKVALDSIIKTKKMVPLDNNNAIFTTQDALTAEKNLIASTKGQAKNLRTMVHEKAMQQLNLTKEQQKKIENLFTSTKQINLVNTLGDSKHLASSLLHVGTQSNRRVHVITPDSFSQTQASTTIKRQAFTKMQWITNLFRSEHIHSVNQLLNNQRLKPNHKDLFIVDSAQQLGKKELQSLVDYAKQHQSKLILLNQTKSRQGFAANNAIEVLKKGHVFEQSWLNSKESKVIMKLHNTSDDKRVEQVAHAYAQSPNREQTQVLAANAGHVEALNLAIRHKLQQQGDVVRHGVKIATKQAVFLSKQQKEIVRNYKKGMVLTVWHQNSHQKKTEYTIANINTKKNEITLVHEKETTKVDPSSNDFKDKNYTLHQVKTISVNQGDQLYANASPALSHLKKHQSFRIVKASSSLFEVKNEAGKTFVVHKKELENASIGYDYARTLNRIDPNKEHTLVSIKSYAASKELAHDLLNTKVQSLDVFTDNQEKVKQRFTQSGIKPSAIQQILTTADAPEKFVQEQTQQTLFKDVAQALQTIQQANTSPGLIQKAVNFAISHIGEKEAGMTQKELIVEAIKYAFEEKQTSITKAEITQHLNQLKADKSLLSAEYHDGTRWTTAQAYKTEKLILQRFEQGKNQVKPLVEPSQATMFLENNTTLTPGQKSAIHLITTTQDRYIGIQGFAGTGKSTMLTLGAELIKESQAFAYHKTKFIGLAPTHAAVDELKDKGIQSQTAQSLLADFLNRKPVKGEHEQTVFFLDESSMISNRQVEQFSQFIEKTSARAVFLGDMHQLTSQAAGKPFELALMRGALDHVVMKDIVRQKNENLLGTVHHIIDHDVTGTLHKVNQQPAFSDYQILPEPKNKQEHREQTQASINQSHSIVSTLKKVTHDKKLDQEIATQALPKAVAMEYLTRTPKSQQETLIIAYTNKERDEIAHHIRDGLKNQNQLDTREQKVPRLRNISTTKAELVTMIPYQVNQILTTGKDQYYKIIEVDKQHDLIKMVNTQNGDMKTFFPKNQQHKMTSLWEKTEQPIAQGEKIILRKTDKERGLQGNKEFTIESIDQQHMTLTSSDQKLKLAHQELCNSHWDYAYTRTADMAQGSTYKHVITTIKGRGQLTNIRRAYIDLTRASEHVKLFTDNSKTMMNSWINKDVNKASAMETIDKTRQENTQALPQKHSIKPQGNLYQRALDYFNHAAKVKGTLGEKYLINRGCNTEVNANKIRFSACVYSSETRTTYPAIIAKLENKDGQFSGIEVTYLDPKTAKLAPELKLNKRVLGAKSDCHIQVHHTPKATTSIITDSIETALKIKQQGVEQNIISFHSLKDLKKIHTENFKKHVILAINNDGLKYEQNELQSIVSRFERRDILTEIADLNKNDSFKVLHHANEAITHYKEQIKNKSDEINHVNNERSGGLIHPLNEEKPHLEYSKTQAIQKEIEL